MQRGVQYEAVACEAERLAGKGEEPTLRAVRAALGTGSMETIRRYLERWRCSRELPLPEYQLSPGVLAALQQEIGARASDVTRRFEKMSAEAREELEAIAAESERRAQQVEEISSELQVALLERSRLVGRLEALELEARRLASDAEEARQVAAVAQASAARIPDLEAALALSRSESRDVEQRGAQLLLEATARAAAAEGELRAWRGSAK